MSSHPYLLGAVCAVPLVYFAVSKWIRPRPIPGIPHYPITSFWGDIPRLTRDIREYGNVFHEDAFYGAAWKTGEPLWQMFVGPVDKWVGVADVQEMEDLLNRGHRAKLIDQSDIMAAAFSATIPYGGICLKTNEDFRRHRRILNPLMSSKYLRSMTPAFAENARVLVDLWKSKARRAKLNGASCFSCKDDFRLAAMDAITSMTIGNSLKAVQHAASTVETSNIDVDIHGGAKFETPKLPLYTALRYLFETMGDAITLPVFIAYLYQQTLKWTPKFVKHYRQAVDSINKSVANARRAVNEAKLLGEEYEAKTLVEMVVEKDLTPGEETLSDRELRDEVLAYIFAGHDTTATALQWGMKFLTENPEVQKKLRQELTTALDNSPESRILTFDDVTSAERTPYLEAVAAEILRCGKVALASSKQTTEPLEILGRVIPARTSIAWCLHAACDNATVENEQTLRALDPLRSESSRKNGLGGRALWSTPTDRFEPERWLSVNKETGNISFNPRAGYSLPFGAGIRSCPGRQLAVLELKIYVATLNLAFFLADVPQELSSHRAMIQISRVPDQAYVAPIPWS